jgi:hypothetical protein
MRLLYFIKINDREYNAFDGEKETRPSTWGLQIINTMLLPYRYL